MKFTEKSEAAIKEAAKEWALSHPVDYLWRKHFNIAFGSPEHLAASFIDQQAWYEEQLFIKSFMSEKDGGGANKGTERTAPVIEKIDMRGMTESDIEELEAKYTGHGAEDRLKQLIPEAIWQRVSTGRS